MKLLCKQRNTWFREILHYIFLSFYFGNTIFQNDYKFIKRNTLMLSVGLSFSIFSHFQEVRVVVFG